VENYKLREVQITNWTSSSIISVMTPHRELTQIPSFNNANKGTTYSEDGCLLGSDAM
jgi:hypothetical protein